jgi:DNA-binding Lrp family transcriptional regulator
MVTAQDNRRIAELAKTGMTYRQVAAVVGLDATTVRRRINRLRANGSIPPAIECRAQYAAKLAAMVAK